MYTCHRKRYEQTRLVSNRYEVCLFHLLQGMVIDRCYPSAKGPIGPWLVLKQDLMIEASHVIKHCYSQGHVLILQHLDFCRNPEYNKRIVWI